MAENLYAGSSVQLFADDTLQVLEHTHEDAKGFLDYVARFHQPNFRITDADVAEWRFDPLFDDAQGWRGVDSAKAYYHSGHGGMDERGVFEAPMGARWATRMSALSSHMRIGDQKLRYLFLSTCDSLRTQFGDDPIRTWGRANRGLRMIFGFGSTSIDWAGYGRDFFRRWNTGISFSQAWQEASLGYSHNQVVSSAACGATAEEAQDRLWNERLFFGERVRDDWYWWRWAGVSPDVEVAVHTGIGVPQVPLHFRAARSRSDRAARLAERFGIRRVHGDAADPGDARTRSEFAPRLVHGEDDAISILLAPADPAAARVSMHALRESAQRIARELDADGRLDLVFDRFTSSYHGGAHRDGKIVAADVADFTAHYRQRFEGVPAAMGGCGHVAITFDRSGRLCRIVDRGVEIVDAAAATPPREPGKPSRRLDVRATLADAQRRLFDPCGRYELTFDPAADEVGYRFVDGQGVLVARRKVTVSAGGMRKAHLVELPIAAQVAASAE